MSPRLGPSAATKFQELASSKASPRAVAAIRRTVTEGSDFDAYKINAFRVAEANGLTRQETLRAFLYATRLGILDLNWDIHCPACTGVPAYEKHLMGLRNRAHCDLCRIDWDLDLEEQVEVTFTVHPEIRRIGTVDWKDRDFRGRMEYFAEIEPREGRGFAAGESIFPGRTVVISGEFGPGEYWFYAPTRLDGWGTLKIAGKRADAPQRVRIHVDARARLDVSDLNLRPGKIEFEVRSDFVGNNAFLVKSRGPEHHWVSAACVTSLQDFRDLFSAEFLAPDVSFSIRSLTLLFTDIRGSTALYEALGDAKAYALVQEHFRILTGFVRRFEGGVVKTIGDAVMAAFPVNVNAVRAAHGIQREFRRKGAEVGGIEVKVGLHRGPVIAVTSNRSLDYFGRTVNIAARVQKKAGRSELVMSGSVSAARLKGIPSGVRLSRVKCGFPGKKNAVAR
ncbi:MAG: adenylate/guanylate cyclase domain-containing protein [Planctomycetes bacterium]|nr:adenylate/guanylate cyclase domain-containing protein [Planctomycetota bacterium]